MIEFSTAAVFEMGFDTMEGYVACLSYHIEVMNGIDPEYYGIDEKDFKQAVTFLTILATDILTHPTSDKPTLVVVK